METEQVPKSSDDHPAPPGWKKQVVPKKSSVPPRFEVVFTAPSGEQFKAKRTLDRYLKANPGSPASSDFDWSTGEELTPTRKSARLSEKVKDSPVDTSTSETKRKKRRSSKGSTEAAEQEAPPPVSGEEEGEAATQEAPDEKKADVASESVNREENPKTNEPAAASDTLKSETKEEKTEAGDNEGVVTGATNVEMTEEKGKEVAEEKAQETTMGNEQVNTEGNKQEQTEDKGEAMETQQNAETEEVKEQVPEEASEKVAVNQPSETKEQVGANNSEIHTDQPMEEAKQEAIDSANENGHKETVKAEENVQAKDGEAPKGISTNSEVNQHDLKENKVDEPATTQAEQTKDHVGN